MRKGPTHLPDAGVREVGVESSERRHGELLSKRIDPDVEI